MCYVDSVYAVVVYLYGLCYGAVVYIISHSDAKIMCSCVSCSVCPGHWVPCVCVGGQGGDIT